MNTVKKIILSVAIIAATIVGAQAQTNTKVKLNVVLNPVLAIEIGNKDASNTGETIPTGYEDVVTLEYKTAQDYKNGVAKNVAGQLKVTAIGSDFKVYVKTSSSHLNRVTGGSENLAGDLVTVQLNGNTRSVRDMIAQQDMGTITGKSTTAKSLDVTYRSAALDDNVLAKLLKNNNGDKVTYTTDVIYSVIPQ